MFFKSSIRPNPDTGHREGYYRLVESYRGLDGRPTHRTLLNVGFMSSFSADQLVEIQHLLTNRSLARIEMFESSDNMVLNETNRLWAELIKKQKVDAKVDPNQWVDSETIEHPTVQELGAEWLCYQAAEQLKLPELFTNLGFSKEQTNLSLMQIISRCIYPYSELKTCRIVKENSAIGSITDYDDSKLTKDVLYTNALKLYANRQALESHLSKTTNDLFDLNDHILIYDLTNTYFEGEKRNSKLAKYGRSKEKRNDCKLIVLAMVINQEGFIKYSNIHEGNMSDPKSLPHLIETLRKKTSRHTQKATVVIDAGIATKENLKLIKDLEYDYVCVSRSKIKDYQLISSEPQITLTDKRGHKIQLQKVQQEGQTDIFLKVESEGKALKEKGISGRFEQLFIEQLDKIDRALNSKGGIKKIEKVWERIGKARQKYPSASQYYEIGVEQDTKRNIALKINYHRKEKPIHHGQYFIQTTLDTKNSETLWKIYNIIREVESTFRSLKTDLDLRPIYHKNDESTKAHIHLAITAYWIVNTIRYQLKQKGIKSDWQEILRVNQSVKWVQTKAKNMANKEMSVFKSSEPNEEVLKIMRALEYKPKFTKILKSVVHKPPT